MRVLFSDDMAYSEVPHRQYRWLVISCHTHREALYEVQEWSNLSQPMRWLISSTWSTKLMAARDTVTDECINIHENKAMNK
jgi:hypothetical protein